MCKGLDQGEFDLLMIPAFSIFRNSALAVASLSGSNLLAFAKTGGPGVVDM